ncbi:YeeE/YedE thiosulfate transporter family protein [Alkaliphilus crotonatoxidans]
MPSEKIEQIKRQRLKQQAPRPSQIPYGIAFSLGILIIYLGLHHYLDRGTYWIIGILIGFTLQRSRFCFTASFRDPIMVGSTSVLRAVIIALMISSLGFYWLQYPAVMAGSYDPLMLPGQIYPVGLHTIIGAVFFGAAMVVAGGCASGTLMRVGEGYIMQLLVLIGFIIGALLGGWHFSFWDTHLIARSPVIYFPQYIGLKASLLLQLILLALLYCLACWFDKKYSMMTQ